MKDMEDCAESVDVAELAAAFGGDGCTAEPDTKAP